MGVSNVLDKEVKYRVEGWGGIAFHLLGYEMIRDEDFEWSGIEEENRDNVRVVMVGDDTVHIVPTKDITPLGDDEYCPECGQIGCKAYG
jgi:hypothetical protein